MAVTQNEIARITGLSRSTVSTILAGKFAHHYHKDTQKQVHDVARRLNYRPNRQALTLKTGKSGIIGVVHTGCILPLTHQKIAEMVRVIAERQLEPLVYHNTWFENSQSIVETLLANKVQGVVLINSYYEGRAADLERLLDTTRVVQSGGYKFPGVPLVAPDKAGAIRSLVRHLVKLGHNEIYMMNTGAGDYPTLNPINAFSEAFEAPELRQVRHGLLNLRAEEGDLRDVFAPGGRALDILKGVMQGPCAVICHNDDAAIGLYLRCLQEGIRVPEEVALTGSDNVVLGRRLPSPLTTIEQPIAEMSRRAIELLLQPEDDPELMELFPCQIIVRASCGASSRSFLG